MIVIHTDASTKNGYSCWAYKNSEEKDYRTGIIKTPNSAAAEIMAIIKGIENANEKGDILIISDALSAVQIIQQVNTNYAYSHASKRYYKTVRDRLMHILQTRCVEAVWVSSNNTNSTHLEVDNIARASLNTYLDSLPKR